MPFKFNPFTGGLDLVNPAGSGGGTGSEILFGTGAPSNGAGADSDVYVDADTGDVYQKLAGSWTLEDNIMGPAGPQGPQGDPGVDGADGATGPAGPTGATGPAGPTGATGPVGATGPQGPAGADGADGTDGAPGSQIYFGTGVPSSGLGIDGDVYENKSNGDLYQKIGGSWVLQDNLTGPQGAQGIQGVAGADGADGSDGAPGADGADGAPGSQIYFGTGAPSSGLGIDGDVYENKTNGDLYQKVSGTWALQDNLTGPQGPAGADGATGPQGPSGVVAATAPIQYNSGTQTVSISAATPSAAGSMSAADKTKLDGIASGATAYTDSQAKAAAVSDTPYNASSWDSVVDVAPSKNAVRDKIDAMDTTIAGKEPTIAAGTNSQYWRGDKSWQTLNTQAVAEHTSFLYYTDARARTATGMTEGTGKVVADQPRLDLNGGAQVISGNGDPSAASGVAAPGGSIFLSATLDGLFYKVGTTDTEWSKYATIDDFKNSAINVRNKVLGFDTTTFQDVDDVLGYGPGNSPSVAMDLSFMGAGAVAYFLPGTLSGSSLYVFPAVTGLVTMYGSGGTDVAVADGGTGASNKTAGFNNLSPLTTKGDLIGRDGTNNVRVAVGSDGQALIADSSQSAGVRYAGVMQVLKKTSDQTNSTTTPQDISSLTVAIAANQVIRFTAYLICSAGATSTGVQLGINGPTIGTGQIAAVTRGWTSTTAEAQLAVNAYETYLASTTSGGTARRVYKIEGVVINGTTAGTFALRHKSSAAALSTIHAGSWLEYTLD
jgi:hypothetical protein